MSHIHTLNLSDGGDSYGRLENLDYRFSYRGYDFLIRYEYICSAVDKYGAMLSIPNETHELRIGWRLRDKPSRFFSRYHKEIEDRKRDFIPYHYIISCKGSMNSINAVYFEHIGESEKELTPLRSAIYSKNFKNLAKYVYHNPEVIYPEGQGSFFDVIRGLAIRFLVDRFEYSYESGN